MSTDNLWYVEAHTSNDSQRYPEPAFYPTHRKDEKALKEYYVKTEEDDIWSFVSDMDLPISPEEEAYPYVELVESELRKDGYLVPRPEWSVITIKDILNNRTYHMRPSEENNRFTFTE